MPHQYNHITENYWKTKDHKKRMERLVEYLKSAPPIPDPQSFFPSPAQELEELYRELRTKYDQYLAVMVDKLAPRMRAYANHEAGNMAEELVPRVARNPNIGKCWI